MPKKMDRFTRSVASRVVVAAMLFLILPLLAFVLFMYFHEYRVKSRDAELILQAVATERTLLIEQELASHKILLKGVEEGAPASVYEKVSICSKKECQSLADRGKPIGEGVILTAGDGFFTLLKQLPNGNYAVIETDIPHFVEQVQGVPDVSLYLLDEHRDVVLSSGGEKKLPDRSGRIWAIKTIGAGGYRLLFDIPETVNYGDFFFRAAVLTILIVCVGGLVVFLLVRRISKPLHSLSSVMQCVGSGDLEARYIEDRMGFEINELGDVFNQVVVSMKGNIERERELKIGHDVQHSLLPTEVPHLPHLDIAARFIPAKEVGGDFYDIYALPNGKLFLVVGDASGKGIFACLYSIIARSLLRAASDQPLAQLVRRANEFLCLDSGESSAFVTAWIGIFDPASRLLEYLNCGHNPAFRKKGSGEIEALTTPGMALGVADFDLQPASIQLGGEDSLIIYTDGIIEAQNELDEFYGEERFLASIVGSSAEEIAQSVIASIEAFSKGAPQYDDIALLVLRETLNKSFAPSSPDSIRKK